MKIDSSRLYIFINMDITVGIRIRIVYWRYVQSQSFARKRKEWNEKKKVMKFAAGTFPYHMLTLFRAWATIFKVDAMLCACRFFSIQTLDVRMTNAQASLCWHKIWFYLSRNIIYMHACMMRVRHSSPIKNKYILARFVSILPDTLNK